MIEGRVAPLSGGMPEAGTAAGPSGCPSDRIFLRGLIREIEIGVYQHEYGVRQRLRFDITVEVGRFPPGMEDELRKVVNYESFVHAIERVAEGPRLQLVESFAERVAAEILSDERIISVEIRIEKLDVLPGGAAFGIEIARRRDGC